MPEERKIDRRVLRTRKSIMRAFTKIASKGDIGKITVSEIAREAGIDRKTFYLHYKSIGELADKKAEDATERIVNRLREDGRGKTPAEQLGIILSEVNAIITADVAFYANAANYLTIDQMLALFVDVVEPALIRAGMSSQVTTDYQMRMRLQFYLAGTISLYIGWLRSDRKQPIETVSDIIGKSTLQIYVQNL